MPPELMSYGIYICQTVSSQWPEKSEERTSVGELQQAIQYQETGQNVLCTRVNRDGSTLSPCSHKEADTRMFIHVADAANQGFHRILLRTMDTDVVVLAVSVVILLEYTEIWITFWHRTAF